MKRAFLTVVLGCLIGSLYVHPLAQEVQEVRMLPDWIRVGQRIRHLNMEGPFLATIESVTEDPQHDWEVVIQWEGLLGGAPYKVSDIIENWEPVTTYPE